MDCSTFRNIGLTIGADKNVIEWLNLVSELDGFLFALDSHGFMLISPSRFVCYLSGSIWIAVQLRGLLSVRMTHNHSENLVSYFNFQTIKVDEKM